MGLGTGMGMEVMVGMEKGDRNVDGDQDEDGLGG